MHKPYQIKGTVTPGRRLGRRLGFPTANVEPGPGQAPDAEGGVWFGRVILPDGEHYWALVNIGVQPAVADGGVYRAEAWLVGYEGDLYGQKIVIELLEYIRPELRFASVGELQQAMEQDKKKANEIIESNEFTL